MAPPRIVDPEGYYHVNATGNFGRNIYEEELHRRVFLHLYARVAKKFKWVTLSYCLMTTHYHVVTRLTEGGLSEGMQLLNGGFSRRMNAIYERTGKGHLFKNRFHGEPIETEEHFLAAVRYVVRNPVEGGICREPADWPWSSYRATVGLEQPAAFLAVDELLTHFDGDVERAREQFRRFVQNGHDTSSDQGKEFVTVA